MRAQDRRKVVGRNRQLLLCVLITGSFFVGAVDVVFAAPIQCPRGGHITSATNDSQCKDSCRRYLRSTHKFNANGFNLRGDPPASIRGKCCCVPPATSGGEASFDVNPLVSENVPELVGNFLRAFFGIIGVIALVIFIYGGLLWMTSMGEEDRVKKGRETMIWAGLGLIAIFGSYTIVQFILDAVLK